MSRFEAWLLHAANLLVGGTGLVYAWMRYLAKPSDPFAVINHPWQPAVQHLHLLAAPLLIFTVGLTFKAHAWCHYHTGVRRRRHSGLSLLAMLVPMAASGYLIQTAVAVDWRRVWIVVHLVASGLWVVAYGGHLLTSKRGRGEHLREPPARPEEHAAAANRSRSKSVLGA